MTERIIYTNENGGVCVVIPAPDSGLTIAEIAAKDVPNGVPFEVVDSADIPSDRTFRDAWRKQGKRVSEDETIARKIAHEKRRENREKDFAPHDRDTLIPDRAAAAERERVKIRNRDAALQQKIDQAKDVAELRKLIKGLE